MPPRSPPGGIVALRRVAHRARGCQPLPARSGTHRAHRGADHESSKFSTRYGNPFWKAFRVSEQHATPRRGRRPARGRPRTRHRTFATRTSTERVTEFHDYKSATLRRSLLPRSQFVACKAYPLSGRSVARREVISPLAKASIVALSGSVAGHGVSAF